jgi:hypothetical protein
MRARLGTEWQNYGACRIGFATPRAASGRRWDRIAVEPFTTQHSSAIVSARTRGCLPFALHVQTRRYRCSGRAVLCRHRRLRWAPPATTRRAQGAGSTDILRLIARPGMRIHLGSVACSCPTTGTPAPASSTVLASAKQNVSKVSRIIRSANAASARVGHSGTSAVRSGAFSHHMPVPPTSPHTKLAQSCRPSIPL